MLDTNCSYIPIVDHATHQVTPIFSKMIHSKGKTFEGKITFSAGKYIDQMSFKIKRALWRPSWNLVF